MAPNEPAEILAHPPPANHSCLANLGHEAERSTGNSTAFRIRIALEWPPQSTAMWPHTTSASAGAEAWRLSSWTGNISMSSRPNSARVFSIKQDARISRSPSVGSISTRTSTSDPADAVPLATETNSLGKVAPHRSSSTWNSSRRTLMSSRRTSVSGVATVSDMPSGNRPRQAVNLATYTSKRNSTTFRSRITFGVPIPSEVPWSRSADDSCRSLSVVCHGYGP